MARSKARSIHRCGAAAGASWETIFREDPLERNRRTFFRPGLSYHATFAVPRAASAGREMTWWRSIESLLSYSSRCLVDHCERAGQFRDIS